MDDLLELAGFSLIALSARTLFGVGVAEAVGGVELLIVAQGVDRAAVHRVAARVMAAVRRRPVPAPNPGK